MDKKICAISDIHGDLIKLPECDILCICGDIVPLCFQRSIEDSRYWLNGPFQDWLLKAPCENVVLIWGNHDFIGEYFYQRSYSGSEQVGQLFDKDTNGKIHILQDELVDIQGIKFYGTPWCPALRGWAFYGDSKTLLEKYSNIPYDTDVLLTHCPPKFGQQGVVLQHNWNHLRDFGSAELQSVLEEKFKESMENSDYKKVHVLSGHIHSGNHYWENIGNVWYANVSIKDENYESIYKPQVFTYYD
jgi:Icc-related predicted phosphoesterase